MAKLVLKNVILSYPRLDEPRAQEGNDTKKYSASFLIRRDDKEQMKQIEDAIIATYEEGIEKRGFTKLKSITLENIVKALGGKVTFYDGEANPHKLYHLGEPDPAELAEYAELRSSANEKYPPALMDRFGRPLTRQEGAKAYGGERVSALLNMYPYNNVSRGIAVGLQGVILTGEAGALGRLSGVDVAAEFEKLDLFDEFDDSMLPQTETEGAGSDFEL